MWIESHSNLARHPKTRRLMKLLGWSLPDTIGNLHLLWWWALDFAPTGDLSRFSAQDLTADLDLCGATPEQFIEAMVAAGFLDRIEETLCIHDWLEYTARSLQPKRRSVPRQRHTEVPSASGHEQRAPSTISPPDKPATPSVSPDSSSPAHALPGQESHPAPAEAGRDSSKIVPPGRDADIPHALDEQPGFTNIWWPKFLDIHEANGTPLTLDARRELLASLARNPSSATELLRALINEAANAITASAPEETLTFPTSFRRDDVGVASPVPNTS